MLLLWALLIGLVIGLVRRGNLSNLAHIDLKGKWLILGALIVQVLIFPLGHSAPVIQTGTEYLHFLSYFFLFVFIVINRHYLGFIITGIGMALNIIVIAANGGYMPASAEALRNAGLDRVAAILESGLHHGNTVLMSAHTKLNFLGDIFSVPKYIPFSTAFSIGDILIGLGIVIFLALEMPRSHHPE